MAALIDQVRVPDDIFRLDNPDDLRELIRKLADSDWNILHADVLEDEIDFLNSFAKSGIELTGYSSRRILDLIDDVSSFSHADYPGFTCPYIDRAIGSVRGILNLDFADDDIGDDVDFIVHNVVDELENLRHMNEELRGAVIIYEDRLEDLQHAAKGIK